jgi:hypothetical protein
MPKTPEILVKCGVCGREVDDGTGHVGISVASVNAYQEKVKAYEAEHPDGFSTFESLVLDYPSTPRWKAHHGDCVEDDHCGYALQVDELRTWKDVAKWTGHVMEKTWCAHTDWLDMISSAASGNDPRLGPAPVRSIVTDRELALVRAVSSIAEIVGERVKLSAPDAEGNAKGLCPFHSEKVPSFNVTPARGMYYCFGCSEGGDVITFIQKIDALTFGDAVEYLADRALRRLWSQAGTTS